MAPTVRAVMFGDQTPKAYVGDARVQWVTVGTTTQQISRVEPLVMPKHH